MDEIGIGAKSEHAGRNGEIEIKALRESQKGENMVNIFIFIYFIMLSYGYDIQARRHRGWGEGIRGAMPSIICGDCVWKSSKRSLI